VTTLHDFGSVLGTAFGHFLLGSYNFMVTALDPCVKWPSKSPMYNQVGLTVGSDTKETPNRAILLVESKVSDPRS
jgi:hypothetical protein